MNIFLIYAVATSAFCSLIASLICIIKPNIFAKGAIYIISVLNLSSLFWLYSYGLGISVYVLATLSIFITINFLRFGSTRTERKELRNSIWLNTGLLLLGLSLIFSLEIQITQSLNFSLFVDSVIGISFIGSITALVNIIRTISKSRLYKTPKLSLAQKPTVTVAIAARNEDKALTDCINAVLSSDYDKMEVLVLDDCSTDGTGSLMSFYANHGVRFISGQEPPLGWLGQNWAYERLSQEASGDYILFLGVDTKISPRTISRIVQYAKFYTYKMISVQPMFLHLDFWPQLLQPLRLLWQTTFRNLLKRPPVSSSLWMIEKKALKDFGGFTELAKKVNPEKAIATKLYESDAYFYAFANADDGVIARKKLSSLWDSAIRSYYPHIGKNPAFVCYTILLIIAALVAPALGLIEAVTTQQYTLSVIFGVIATIIWWICHLILVTRVNPSGWFLAIFNLPIMIIVEVGLSLTSMFKYEFGKITWKGRNICWLDKEEQLKLKAWKEMQSNLRS
jgi:glycosyltransferase involved in cell wall biosynthesis